MKNLKKSPIKSVVNRYLILSFLIILGASTTAATYVPFMLSKAMNLWQINLINAFFMAAIILMEMPTGSFADKFGRHNSVKLSFFLHALGLLIYFISGNLWLFIIAEIIAGISLTFSSGALEAWLVDSLEFHAVVRLKAKIFRREAYFNSAGLVIGSLSGAYIGNQNLSWPWLLGAAISVLAGIYSLSLTETYRQKDTARIRVSLIKQIKLACDHGFNNRHIVSFMALGAIFSIATQALNMQWTVVFQRNFHLEISELGWIFVGIAILISLGSSLSKYSLRLFKDAKKTLAITQIITAIVIIILASVTGLVMTLSLFFLHELTRGMFKPIKQSFFNDHLLSETRASVLSLDSMINKIGSLIGLLISGWLAQSYSIKVAWLVSGIFLLVALLLFLIPKKPKTD
jgi:MFS family permease